MFFQKRRSGHFGLHSANNACGREILNVRDLNSMAETMAREMAAAEHPEVPTSLHPRDIPSSVWQMRRMCAGSGRRERRGLGARCHSACA